MDDAARNALSQATPRRPIYLLSHSLVSPSTRQVIDQLRSRYAIEHVSYDAISYSAALQANNQAFGTQGLPLPQFDKAQVVVSFEADFLGTWLSPTLFAQDFIQKRKLENTRNLNRLYVFESNFSITGAQADHRFRMHPAYHEQALATLYNLLAQALNRPTLTVAATPLDEVLSQVAEALLASRRKSLVLSGLNTPTAQRLIIGINLLLGNYDSTLNRNKLLYTKQGNDQGLAKALEAITLGRSQGVIFYNCNPVYDHPLGGCLGRSDPPAAFFTSYELQSRRNKHLYRLCSSRSPLLRGME